MKEAETEAYLEVVPEAMEPFAVGKVGVGVVAEGFADMVPAVDWTREGRDEDPVVKEGPLRALDWEVAVAVSALHDREMEMIEALQLLYQELFHRSETVQQQMGLELLGPQVLGTHWECDQQNQCSVHHNLTEDHSRS